MEVRSYRNSDYADVKQNLQKGQIFDQQWDSQERLAQKIKRNPQSIIVVESEGKVIANIYIVEDD